MKARWILAVAIVTVASTAAYAGPMGPISYISVPVAPTTFEPTGGLYGIGVLTMEDMLPVVIHRTDDSQTVLLNTNFYLSASLKTDNSADGWVDGLFVGGNDSVLFQDSGNNDLLRGRILELTVSEAFNDMGILAAYGLLRIDSGSLLPDFGYPTGAIYQILFSVSPAVLDDFSEGFSGYGNISLSPVIPDPAGLCIVLIGVAGLVTRRRFRS